MPPESKRELENSSSSTCVENEPEESGKTTAYTELRKDKIAYNGDACSSRIIDILMKMKQKVSLSEATY